MQKTEEKCSFAATQKLKVSTYIHNRFSLFLIAELFLKLFLFLRVTPCIKKYNTYYRDDDINSIFLYHDETNLVMSVDGLCQLVLTEQSPLPRQHTISSLNLVRACLQPSRKSCLLFPSPSVYQTAVCE